MSKPRVSILIPNFDNGRESSTDGQTDLIGDLMQSLHDTLADDPTPLEIIVWDDGSCDDSLQTLREWSQRTWRGGEPFLTLHEAEHCGVLAVTANKLVEASRGEILCRLDGDIVVLTKHWASRLCEVFDAAPPRLGVVGPKQLGMNGAIHSFGDWLLHPKGYHHIAMGLPREAATRAMECDHVMGCFYCCKREVHDTIGGYDEDILRGQTIDFGLRARQNGYSCIAIPQIEFIHRHGARKARSTRADTAEGVKHTLDVFENKWGFGRISPDLDVVREKFAGSDLLWNAAVFSGDQPFSEPVQIQDSHWQRYAQNEAFRKMVDLQVLATIEVSKQVGQPKHILLPACGTGLLAHLLATRGFKISACDRDENKLALAKQCIANQTYPGQPPTFVHQTDRRKLPFADGTFDMMLAYYLFERHENPVGLLKEFARVGVDNPWLTVVSARKRSDHLDDERYHPHELIAQINSVRGWAVKSDPAKDNPSQPMVVVAQHTPPPINQHQAA